MSLQQIKQLRKKISSKFGKPESDTFTDEQAKVFDEAYKETLKAGELFYLEAVKKAEKQLQSGVITELEFKKAITEAKQFIS